MCALDADDILEATYLEKAVQVLEENDGIAFVSSWLEMFGTEAGLWRPDRCDLPTVLGECTVCTAALTRIPAVLAVGGYDERMPEQGYEDWDLWISLLETGFCGVILPEVLFRYRRRAGSMSSVCCVGEPHLRLMRYLVEKHRPSYEAHLDAVLARKDREAADLLSANDDLERRLHTRLLPAIEARRSELQRLTARLNELRAAEAIRGEHAALKTRMAGLEEALAREREQTAVLDLEMRRAREEVEALRSSASWAVTAPMRRLYDVALGIRRRIT